MKQIFCWKCGFANEFTELKIGRSDGCRQCNASLHVCRQCLFYAPKRHNHCREPVAEWVTDKTRANFCDYFSPNQTAFSPPKDSSNPAREKLNALFDQPDIPEPTGSIDDLFNKTRD